MCLNYVCVRVVELIVVFSLLLSPNNSYLFLCTIFRYLLTCLILFCVCFVSVDRIGISEAFK